MSNGKGNGPRKGYNQAKYAANYDAIFRRKGTQQPTQPMKTPEQEQPKHAEQSRQLASLALSLNEAVKRAELLQDHYECKMDTPQRVSRMEAQHATTLRLLEAAADQIESGEQDTFGLTAYQENLCKAIRAHLAAMKGSQ